MSLVDDVMHLLASAPVPIVRTEDEVRKAIADAVTFWPYGPNVGVAMMLDDRIDKLLHDPDWGVFNQLGVDSDDYLTDRWATW